MTAACAAGSIGSTLAWYAYSTRAIASYSGTSVASTKNLQIGIASDVVINDMPSTIADVTFTNDPIHYYFATTGTGLTYDVISKYLTAKSYATNELEPTTSGSYTTGVSNFSLKKAPNQSVHGNVTPAEKKNYLTIPFVFRIVDENDNYVSGQELWLSNAIARANTSRDGNIYKALRVFVDRDDTIYPDGDFIFNPSDTQAGRTRVGGVLNLSDHGYYDFDSNGEILYGEFDPAALNDVSDDGYEGEDVLHDVNGTGYTGDKPTTFTAKHYPHIKYYSSLNDSLFGHAEYKSLADIAPARDEHDYISNADENHPTSVCKTDPNNHNIAKVNLTIWLEGWDFSVVDEEQKHKFDLGLTFEISRVQ